jgi:beta-lactamase class A
MTVISNSIGRRAVLAGGAGLLLAGAAPAASDFSQQITAMEATLGGRIGVAALDTGTGAHLSHRGRERFAMCSSFKWLLAAHVLASVDHGALRLGQDIAYSESDLLSTSPVTRAHVGEGHLTIEQLCAATVEVSDNAAANLLLGQVGGPEGLTRFLRGIGDPVTRLDRTELALNSNIPGDPRDTTVPDAMITTMKTILLGEALKPASREKLLQWMKESTTGLGRLRAGLPKGWVAGDKTGSGINGPSNDNAIAWPPGRAPILIVTYVDASKATAKQREEPHAKIAALIAQAFVEPETGAGR